VLASLLNAFLVNQADNPQNKLKKEFAFAVHGRGHFSREEPNRPASRYDGVKRVRGPTLRANISETVLVLLINEQGEKEKGRDEREFS
jgi:hypothetical protein